MSGFPDVTENAAFEAAIGGERPVIVKFQSEACVICRKVEPMLAATAKRFDGALSVVDADAEKNSAAHGRAEGDWVEVSMPEEAAGAG